LQPSSREAPRVCLTCPWMGTPIPGRAPHQPCWLGLSWPARCGSPMRNHHHRGKIHPHPIRCKHVVFNLVLRLHPNGQGFVVVVYTPEPNISLRICTHTQTMTISNNLCPPMPTHSMTCAHSCPFLVVVAQRISTLNIVSRATSHMRLRACEHNTSSILIGGKGGAGPSSLHTTLDKPME
jgi:hypothetical protein